jgi:MFS family permease
MLIYAYGDSLTWIMVSRIVAGLAAANVVVIQAYFAELTSEEERGAVMGRIGAAISIGLIGGPFVGGQLAQSGGSHLLGLVAAAASGLGMAILLIGMKGVKPKEERRPGKAPIIDLRLFKEFPELRRMFVLAAVAWFALACLEGTFGRLLAHRFHFPLTEFGLTFTKPQGASGAVFGLESLVSFAVQGLLFAWISSRIAYGPLLRIGYVMQGVGLLLTAFAPGLGAIFLFSSIYSIGGALANPTVNTICSNLVPESRQGELFGLLQAARSVGFLFGPLLGGALFDLFSAAPYILAGGVATFAALLVPKLPAKQRAT